MAAPDPDLRDRFEALTTPFRREVRVHCYRLLGSVPDAEDLLQETWLRAWQAFERFEGGAVRAWLYRIATHACLDALERRDRQGRVLPDALGPASTGPALGPASPEVPWLEPIPQALLEGVVDDTPQSHALRSEAVRLAFLTALHRLSPRQRAAVLLCEVLGWTAAEAAAHLDVTTAAVTSALQRARASLASPPPPTPTPTDLQRQLLERYVHAWEAHDLDAFVALLAEEAVFSMPPWAQWYAGRASIRAFFAHAWRSCHGLRLVPVAANASLALAVFEAGPAAAWQPHSLHVLEFEGPCISRLTTYVPPMGPRLLEHFDVHPSPA